MKKINKIQFASIGTLFLLLISTSCSTIRLQLAQFTEDKKSDLPQNIQTADEDADIAKESSCIVTVNEDDTFLIGKEKVSLENLTSKIVEKMEGKTPDKRIVYIESPVDVQYQTIVKLLSSIRKAEIEKAGLIAYKRKYEKLGERPSRVEVKILDQLNMNDFNLKPNPLTLVVSIDKNESLRLNMESIGDLANTQSLTQRLTEVFKEREMNGVFREGTNEIEKTISIKPSLTLKYGDVIKIIDAVKLAGGQPIKLQIDDLAS